MTQPSMELHYVCSSLQGDYKHFWDEDGGVGGEKEA